MELKNKSDHGLQTLYVVKDFETKFMAASAEKMCGSHDWVGYLTLRLARLGLLCTSWPG